MPGSTLLHELIATPATRTPTAQALTDSVHTLGYRSLDAAVRTFAAGLMRLGLPRPGRVGIYLEKRV